MVMSRRRMHQKDAIILAGLLGGVLLLLFSPLWGPMDLACTGIVFRTGGCIRSGNKKRRKKRNERRAKTASYRK